MPEERTATAPPAPTRAPGPGSDLGRLVETERRLEDRVAAARVEAARLVAEAEAAAQARERALEAELEAAGRALEAEIAAEGERERVAIEVAAAREAVGFEGVSPDRVAALAAWVVGRVLREEGGG